MMMKPQQLGLLLVMLLCSAHCVQVGAVIQRGKMATPPALSSNTAALVETEAESKTETGVIVTFIVTAALSGIYRIYQTIKGIREMAKAQKAYAKLLIAQVTETQCSNAMSVHGSARTLVGATELLDQMLHESFGNDVDQCEVRVKEVCDSRETIKAELKRLRKAVRDDKLADLPVNGDANVKAAIKRINVLSAYMSSIKEGGRMEDKIQEMSDSLMNLGRSALCKKPRNIAKWCTDIFASTGEVKAQAKQHAQSMKEFVTDACYRSRLDRERVSHDNDRPLDEIEALADARGRIVWDMMQQQSDEAGDATPFSTESPDIDAPSKAELADAVGGIFAAEGDHGSPFSWGGPPADSIANAESEGASALFTDKNDDGQEVINAGTVYNFASVGLNVVLEIVTAIAANHYKKQSKKAFVEALQTTCDDTLATARKLSAFSVVLNELEEIFNDLVVANPNHKLQTLEYGVTTHQMMRLIFVRFVGDDDFRSIGYKGYCDGEWARRTGSLALDQAVMDKAKDAFMASCNTAVESAVFLMDPLVEETDRRIILASPRNSFVNMIRAKLRVMKIKFKQAHSSRVALLRETGCEPLEYEHQAVFEHMTLMDRRVTHDLDKVNKDPEVPPMCRVSDMLYCAAGVFNMGCSKNAKLGKVLAAHRDHFYTTHPFSSTLPLPAGGEEVAQKHLVDQMKARADEVQATLVGMTGKASAEAAAKYWVEQAHQHDKRRASDHASFWEGAFRPIVSACANFKTPASQAKPFEAPAWAKHTISGQEKLCRYPQRAARYWHDQLADGFNGPLRWVVTAFYTVPTNDKIPAVMGSKCADFKKVGTAESPRKDYLPALFQHEVVVPAGGGGGGGGGGGASSSGSGASASSASSASAASSQRIVPQISGPRFDECVAQFRAFQQYKQSTHDKSKVSAEALECAKFCMLQNKSGNKYKASKWASCTDKDAPNKPHGCSCKFCSANKVGRGNTGPGVYEWKHEKSDVYRQEGVCVPDRGSGGKCSLLMGRAKNFCDAPENAKCCTNDETKEFFGGLKRGFMI
eukprot:TRINITY_DN65989_c5_g17_i1.p1 TRINITY_DN65989_c5_g17~~TRINITY_DN65989_c5_g17_i1.p1  ORF type:complete len:1039 (+),score=610.24 TRINITY_DN65989_c5_g17_i1:39-3155(+)